MDFRDLDDRQPKAQDRPGRFTAARGEAGDEQPANSLAASAAAGEQDDPRFTQITREKVSDRVAQEIMHMIATGRLAPGECLPGERQIARMMKVSRVSVRAALQQLKTQGLLHAIQGGATRVSASAGEMDSALGHLVRADIANLYDLAEIRASLEVWAVRRAAANASEAQLAEVEAAFARMCDGERAADHKVEDDADFHLAIAKAAGSTVYLHLMSVLGDLLQRSVDYHRNALVTGAQGDALVLNHHRRILEALKGRDADAAAEAMADHLNAILANYREAPQQEAASGSQTRGGQTSGGQTADVGPFGGGRSRQAGESLAPRAGGQAGQQGQARQPVRDAAIDRDSFRRPRQLSGVN